MINRLIEPCALLPPAARALLQQAASTPDNPQGTRQKAIEKATEKVRREHPEFFRKED